MNDENVVYVAKLHWLIFCWPLALACASMYLGIRFDSFKELFLIFTAFFVIWALFSWVMYHVSSLTIEKKRVIFRTGLLVRKTTDIPYTKIESMDIRQSLLGSLFSYGAFMITGTGGTRHFITFLAKPLTCRRYIEQLMNA